MPTDPDTDAADLEKTLSPHSADATLSKSAPPETAPGVGDPGLRSILLDGAFASAGPPPTRRADYTVLATLGEGGMGRVLLARDSALSREVAIKTLKEGASDGMRRALSEEARLTGSLEHPGVIPVHAFGVDDEGRPLLVMKRVDGVDLGTLLRDRAHPLWKARTGSDDPLVAGLEIVMQVCRTVEFAHSRHVLHRDIKPENVMVGSFGEVYLVDWGLGTTHGSAAPGIVGTPMYMAPEMASGGPLDARTDVYLLGATLHEVLTGRPRHDGASVTEVLRQATQSAPVDYAAQVPAELAGLLNRATAKDPGARPPSAKAFREELAEFLRHRSAHALSDLARERLDELDRLMAAAGPGAPGALSDAYRLITEARFGLTQSLREHASDAAARDGMRRCLTAALELELRQEHAESAEALLRELDPAPAELSARVAAVRERLAERSRERERLERLDRDADPTELAGWRSAALAVLAVGLVGLLVAFRRDQASPAFLLAFAVGAACLVFVGAVWLRRRAFVNAFNQKTTALVLLASVAMAANRALGLVEGRTARATVTIDLLVFAVVVGAGAISMFRAMWACSAVLACGVVAIQLVPDRAVELFVATMALTFASWAWLVRSTRRGDS